VSRVLLLLPSIPTSLDAGARIRNHGVLRLLAEHHDVDVIAFGDDVAGLDRIAHTVTLVPLPERTLVGRVADLACSPLPDMARRLWSPRMRETVKRALETRQYSAVQAEGIEMAPYLALVSPAYRIYDAHNAEFLLQRRLMTDAPARVARLYSRVQWRRLERFERQLIQASRMTLAVSEHDANQLLALAGPDANVRVVRNGIDVRAYAFAEPKPDQAPNVLFVGKLDFRPNSEALRWFVEAVLPRTEGVRLFAVGASPPNWLVRAGQHNDRIAVTGYVDDEQPYLQRSMALVLPVTAGGGSRLKALIAMSSGLPIVSTRFGMEGLDAEPDTHYLAADSAADFAACIDRLRDDVELRCRLAHAGRRLVESRYDWSAIRPELDAAYAWLER
jgi:glycosyltransferase involved in cell wall biosynthesis